MFALDIFNSIEKEVRSLTPESKNVFISPLSIFTALSMTNNGADGNLRKDLSKVLYIENFDIEVVNSEIKNMKSILEDKERNIELLIANSIWQADNFPIKESFITIMKTFYNAFVTTVAFGEPETAQVINKWISDNTKGLIKDMVDETSYDDIMYLVNAIYFFGNWIREFDPKNTKDEPFYLLDGKSVNTPMMKEYDTYLYYKDKNFHAIRLSYGKIEEKLDEIEFYNKLFSTDEFVSMYLFVPYETDGIYEMIDSLNHDKLNEIFNNFYPKSDIDLSIPKFEIEFGNGPEKNILDNLISIGMPVKDNFANLTDKLPDSLYISKVLHQAVVKVNEKGTEAAAATVVGIKLESMREILKFKADRPFLFIIRDDKTKTILFMGILKNPSIE
jgi:serpin B